MYDVLYFDSGIIHYFDEISELDHDYRESAVQLQQYRVQYSTVAAKNNVRHKILRVVRP